MFEELRRIGHGVKLRMLRASGAPVYNITSSKALGFTWFRVAKCGTRTMLSVFEKHCKFDIDGSCVRFHKVDHSDNFKFCIIRNPWDRLVSCYSDKVQGRKMFKKCWDKKFDYFVKWCANQDLNIADRHIQHQVSLFPVKEVDHIGNFENFSEEFNFIMNDKLGLNVDLIAKNKSSHAHYSTYYTEETQKLVSQIYAADIDVGNFKFVDRR